MPLSLFLHCCRLTVTPATHPEREMDSHEKKKKIKNSDMSGNLEHEVL